MSRSKKNWDHLVSEDGNYIPLNGGGGGGSGTKGSKGDKGSTSEKGEKGTAASPFTFKGSVPTFGDLPSASSDTQGQIYKVADTGKYYVSDGAGSWTEITGISSVKGETGADGEKGSDGDKGAKGDASDKGDKGETGGKGEDGQKGQKGEGDKGSKGDEGIEGEKGDKGEIGPKGDKGEIGDKGVGDKGVKGDPATIFTYKGEVADIAALPGGAAIGDVYKTQDTSKFYAWNGSGWDELPGLEAIKGQKGIKGEGEKGQKGTEGDKGVKGEKGNKGTKGEEGQKGNKGDKGIKGEIGEKGDKGIKGEIGDKGNNGEKGEKGEGVDETNYYNKGEISVILEDYYTKGETYSKGQVDAELQKNYTKGEVDLLFSDVYLKTETYDRNYIDAKDNNRYTKGEVDNIIKGLGDEYVPLPYTPLLGNLPPTKGAAADGTLRIGELFYNINDLALYVYAQNASADLGWWPTATDYTAPIADITSRLQEIEASLPPIGTISFWMNGTTPTNYLRCNGGNFSSVDYPDLATLLGATVTPDLVDWMPAGTGGKFGSTLGNTVNSKLKAHSHSVTRLEPGDTTGYPNGSVDSSTSDTRYWRGNNSGNGSEGNNTARTTTTVGDTFTAPPVLLGHWVIRAK